MEITAFRFTAKQLRSIHKDHLGFILASSHCCNELTSVGPYIIFEHDSETANEVEKSFILLRFFTLVRLQVAKIFEYRDLCNRYVKGIRATFPATAKRVSEQVKPISRKIDSARWAQTLRNKVAFHFDASYVVQALEQASPDDGLAFFVGRIRGLTSFDFADKILVNSMFTEAGKGNSELGNQIVLEWATDLRQDISAFHAKNMIEIFDSYGLLSKREKVELRDSYCAAMGTTTIPISTVRIENSETE